MTESIQERLEQAIHNCPACDGNDNSYLGQLGQLHWLRCDCYGWEFYIKEL